MDDFLHRRRRDFDPAQRVANGLLEARKQLGSRELEAIRRSSCDRQTGSPPPGSSADLVPETEPPARFQASWRSQPSRRSARCPRWRRPDDRWRRATAASRANPDGRSGRPYPCLNVLLPWLAPSRFFQIWPGFALRHVGAVQSGPSAEIGHHAPILVRRGTRVLLEETREVALGGKAKVFGDVADFAALLSQTIDRRLDAQRVRVNART